MKSAAREEPCSASADMTLCLHFTMVQIHTILCVDGEAISLYDKLVVHFCLNRLFTDMKMATTLWSAVPADISPAASVSEFFIARAMLKAAPVVILDEATANVDPENENDLMKAIQALTREKTVIMIAHRLKTVEHADQILVVDHGKIVQQGSHENLMQEEGIYRIFISERREAASWKVKRQ